MKEIIHSLRNKLNNIIDNELEKSTNDINANLIAECCDGLLRTDNISKYLITEKEAKENISRILNNGKEKKKLKKPVKALLIAAIIAILLAATAVGYAQIKYDILHFSDHSTVTFDHSNNKKVNDLTIGYIPDGFELDNNCKTKHSISMDYSNEDKSFGVTKSFQVKEVDINTEYEDYKVVNLNDTDYILFGEAEHGQGILWEKDGYMYIMSGNISKSEMLKIAISIV